MAQMIGDHVRCARRCGLGRIRPTQPHWGREGYYRPNSAPTRGVLARSVQPRVTSHGKRARTRRGQA